MYVSRRLSPGKLAETRPATIRWLTEILDSPTLSGRDLLPQLKGVIYIDSTPRILTGGHWEIGSDTVYLARASSHVNKLERLAILSVIANMTGVIDDTTITTKISIRLTEVIKESVASVYGAVVESEIPPTQLALNLGSGLVAVNMREGWFLPGGAPVMVDDSWITMDF